MEAEQVQQRGPVAVWAPRNFVRGSCLLSETAFLDRLGSAYALLVRLTGDSRSILAGLTSSSQLTVEEHDPQDRISFGTVQRSADSVLRGMEERKQLSAALGESAQGEISRDMLVEPYFIVPLSCREAGNLQSHRVSVGRARNLDVVLRDKTVSKFHAWIYPDERDGQVHLQDVGSTNRSSVNGLSVEGRVVLSPGDKICFGAVEAVLCRAKSIWAALVAG